MNFDDIKYEISDFAHEKPVLLTIISIVIFLFIAGLVILMIQTSPAKKEAPEKVPEPFTANESTLIPDSPDIEKDYYPNRVTENQWTQNDINTWFTYPEDDTMAELEKANDSIIQDLTGAAP
ncbi:MAG: hypothetical protein IJ257_01640 [Treponema sp.]|nr:hypothetical protein [Treponema sp.]